MDVNEMLEQLTDRVLFCKKEVLTSEEAARYMGVKLAYLYKLTMQRKIPHSKPLGKKCYFKRAELEEWLMSNKIATEEELENLKRDYLHKL